MADVILINKIDLISEEEKAKVHSLVRYVLLKYLTKLMSFVFLFIRSINITAQVYETTRSW